MNDMQEEWAEVELGNVCNYSKGKKPKVLKKNQTNETPLPYINIKAFEKGIYDQFTDGKKCNLCEEGDLLMVWDGARAGFAGKAKKGAIGSTLMKIEPGDGIEKNYLFYFLLSLYKKLNTNPRGVGIPHVEPRLLWDSKLIIPPLPIQRAIVTKIENLFTSLDKGIADLKKAQEQLKVYRQAVLEKALTGQFTVDFRKKNPQLENSEVLFQKIQEELDANYKKACQIAAKNGERKPKDQRKNKKANNVTSYLPDIPKSWNYYRLEDVTYLVTDGTHHTPSYIEKGIRFLSVKNVRPFSIKDDYIKYISEEEHAQLVKRCNPENGDILYTKVGATFGYAYKIELDYEFSIFVSLCLIKPVYKYLVSDFLELLMNSEIVFRQARQRVSGSGVPDLHLIEIRDFKIPLPAVEEQHQIVREIESRLSVCDKVEQNITEGLEKSEALRQSILKKAFEGKLLSEAEIEKCKQAADYEPASVLLEKIRKEKKK